MYFDRCRNHRFRSGLRFAFLATMVLVPILMSSNAAQAQATIQGGTTVTVPGTQASPWNVGGDLTVGNTGAGTLNIGATGVVNNANSIIGAQVSGQGTVSVGGTGATWNSTGTVGVGSSGVGTLAIFGGGAVNANSSVIGGSNLGTVGVSGIGSIWNNTVSVTIGSAATGTGFVTISAGGAGTTSTTTIGNQANATGTLNVTDAGSTWDSANMTVGLSGTGTLNVSNGGAVTSANASVGGSSGSSGTATVTGAGSSWIVTNNFSVGGAGQGQLFVLNGATMTGGTFQNRIGVSNGSDGTVTVSGTGSIWNANQLHIGDIGDFAINGNGGSGTLNITSGGRVNSTSASVAVGNGATGAVSVSGAGSLWSNTGDLSVGAGGGASGFVSGGGLAISNGGQVTTTGNAYVGQSSEGNGQVTVTGAGSSFTAGSELTVGAGGIGFFTVGDAATVTVGGGTGIVRIATAPTSNGVLSIGGGFGDTAAAPGSLQADVVAFGAGSGILYFNHTSSNYIFAPGIQGAGTIIQAAGYTTLSENSLGFSGNVNVTGGTLSVNGSLASGTLNVATGGTLGGTGTVGNTTIASGGTLAPGNSIGTLTVAGSLTFNSGSFFAVEVSPTAADRVNATGAATIDGTVAATFASGTYLTKSYTILSADLGRTGTFNTLQTTNLPSGFTAALDYTNTDVLLNLTAILGTQAIGGPLPGNQQNVAYALNNYFNNGGALPPQYVSLFGLTGQTLVNALGQADGQNATGIQQSGFQATGQFLGLMLDPFAAQSPASSANARAVGFASEDSAMSPIATAAYAAAPVKAKPIVYTDASRWNVWAAGFGGSQRTRGDVGAGTSDTTSQFGGFAAGADYRVAPRTTLGFALAGGGTSWGIADGLGSGKADVFHAGLYGTHRWGAAYVAAALSYSWYGTTTDRTVGLAGTDVLRGRFDAHSFGGRVETGYRYALGNFGITPQAALQVISIRTPSYGETAISGLSTFALNYAAQTTNSTRSELGMVFDRTTLLESGNTIAWRARAAWGHEFDTSRRINATFQALPGATFTVNGAKPSMDSALLSASADIGFAQRWTVGAKFDGEFSGNTASYAGTGRVKYAW